MTALPEQLRDTAALVLGEELTHAEAAVFASLAPWPSLPEDGDGE